MVNEIFTLFVLTALINYKERPALERVKVYDDKDVLESERGEQ